MRGFTIIEMMIVVGIVSVISAVVLTGQGSFGKTIILTNTAYDVALSIRSAETYGLGGRVVSGVPVNTGYGLHFDRTNKTAYTIFADNDPAANAGNCHGLPIGGATAIDAQPGNCAYRATFDKDIITYTLGNGIRINDFCAYNGSWTCGIGLGTLDIVFARPNPIPFISTGGAYVSSPKVTDACLVLTSPQGTKRCISIASSGNINANASSCGTAYPTCP